MLQCNATELIYKTAAYSEVSLFCSLQLQGVFFLQSTRWQHGNLNTTLRGL